MGSKREGVAPNASIVLAPFLERLRPEERAELLARVLTLVEQGVQAERQRCIERCLERANRWRTTANAKSPLSAARDEARFRGNEAEYLADLLEVDESSS